MINPSWFRVFLRQSDQLVNVLSLHGIGPLYRRDEPITCSSIERRRRGSIVHGPQSGLWSLRPISGIGIAEGLVLIHSGAIGYHVGSGIRGRRPSGFRRSGGLRAG